MHSGRDALLQSHVLLEPDKRRLKNVSLRLHPDDDMYSHGRGREYLAVGLSALQCINTALAHARGDKPVKSILDFPGGYGRTIRFLKIEFPEAEIFGCDINPQAVHFLRQTFNVSASVSNADFSSVYLPGNFDLIFSGSLLTHLDERRAVELLRLYYRNLAPGGVCVFSMHGSTSVEWLKRDQVTYDLSDSLRTKLLSDFEATGYGYANLPAYVNYGISLASYLKMLELASQAGDLKLSSYCERGWAKHHNVYAFVKGNSGAPLIMKATEPAPIKRKHEWVEFY